MNFRTPIHLLAHNYQINYNDSIFCIGSCFAENMSNRLSECKFEVDVNPFGVVYNPISIQQSLERIIENIPFSDEGIHCDINSGLYFSYDAYTLFNNEIKSEVLRKLNEKLDLAHKNFMKSTVVVITLGTSFIYKLRNSGDVVANCQKQHPEIFLRERLTVMEVSQALNSLFSKNLFKDKQVILTVSPIRHKKDGFQANMLSKATLLCGVHEMCERYENVNYFPSYEIMMDDLRDYRFYAEDMIHPSDLAIEYIWEQFKGCYISETAQSMFKEIKLIQKRLNHRPFNPESETHKKFLTELKDKIEILNKKMGKNIF
ncbi:MAG: GSCFA domain-containing protein [Rikenellaceae bacterium]